MNNLLEIDLKPLETALSIKFGDVPINLTKKLSTRSGKERLTICSQDLKDKAGVLSNSYDYLHITDFGSETYHDHIWMGINWSFSYVHGGSNGTNIGNCWYYFETKEWIIELP